MAFMSPTTEAGWSVVPSTYIFTIDDLAVSLPFQQVMVKRARVEQERRGGGVVPFSGKLAEAAIQSGNFVPSLQMLRIWSRSSPQWLKLCRMIDLLIVNVALFC
jgi:hypothetical protein